MVEVDGEEVEESFAASSGHCVAGVVHVRPGIGSLSQTAVGHQIQHSLEEEREGGRKRGREGGREGGRERGRGRERVKIEGEERVLNLVGVFLAAHEHEVLQSVGEAVVIVSLRCYGIT